MLLMKKNQTSAVYIMVWKRHIQLKFSLFLARRRVFRNIAIGFFVLERRNDDINSVPTTRSEQHSNLKQVVDQKMRRPRRVHLLFIPTRIVNLTHCTALLQYGAPFVSNLLYIKIFFAIRPISLWDGSIFFNSYSAERVNVVRLVGRVVRSCRGMAIPFSFFYLARDPNEQQSIMTPLIWLGWSVFRFGCVRYWVTSICKAQRTVKLYLVEFASMIANA